MTDKRAEQLIRLAVRTYHSADILDFPPESFKTARSGARVKPRLSFVSAAAVLVIVFSAVFLGISAFNKTDSSSVAEVQIQTNETVHKNGFDKAVSTLRIDGKPISLPLTIGALCEYADIYKTQQADGETAVVFCKIGTKDICFKATAKSADADSRVTTLYVCSAYKASDLLSIMDLSVGDEYGSIVEDYYRSYGFKNEWPVDAYRKGSAALIRRGDGGEVIEGVFFEPDEKSGTLCGIRIVFGSE